MSSHMLSLLCVSSCSLSHSASPSAVIMAGWSRWNCTCLKHALRCHPSLFPFLTVGARMAKLNEKRGGPNKSPALLFTNHRLFPTLFAFIAPSLPPCSLPSFLLPPSVSKHANHRKKKSREKTDKQLLGFAFKRTPAELVWVSVYVCVVRSVFFLPQ